MHCTTSNKPLLSILQIFNHFSLLELWLMLIVRIKTSYCSERIIKSIMWIKLLSNSASWSLFGFTSVHQFMGRTHSTFKESKNCIKTSLKLIAALCIEIKLQCEYTHWALILITFGILLKITLFCIYNLFQTQVVHAEFTSFSLK